MPDRTALRPSPTRTCVGCRKTDSWSALLRVVAAKDPAVSTPHGVVLAVPDPLHRRPGRGAWVHLRPECFEQAVRRKAFARALRLRAPVDLDSVAEHVAAVLEAEAAEHARSFISTNH